MINGDVDEWFIEMPRWISLRRESEIRKYKKSELSEEEGEQQSCLFMDYFPVSDYGSRSDLGPFASQRRRFGTIADAEFPRPHQAIHYVGSISDHSEADNRNWMIRRSRRDVVGSTHKQQTSRATP